jgi:mono/diheme cytochrome c family protein
MLMMSWRNINLPIMLVPEKKGEELPLIADDIPAEKLSLVEWGKELFESKDCSGCHTITGEVEIGPDLKGITKKRDAEWLKKMIQNPEEMEKTDPLAKKLYLEFEEMGMVSDALTDEEVEAILKYIESFD